MTPKRPNILWYCTDQQRFDTIGALGNRHVKTPTIDGLVKGGVAFTHAYCQSPICTPSRASFLTGMYPSKIRNRALRNWTSYLGMAWSIVLAGCVLLPDLARSWYAVELSLSYPIFYMGLSFALGGLHRPDADASKAP